MARTVLALSPTVSEKACSRCKEIKPADAFYPNKFYHTGLGCACKECLRADKRKSWAEMSADQREREQQRQKAKNKSDYWKRQHGVAHYLASTFKTCERCQRSKPLNEFGSKSEKGFVEPNLRQFKDKCLTCEIVSEWNPNLYPLMHEARAPSSVGNKEENRLTWVELDTGSTCCNCGIVHKTRQGFVAIRYSDAERFYTPSFSKAKDWLSKEWAEREKGWLQKSVLHRELMKIFSDVEADLDRYVAEEDAKWAA